MSKPLSVSELAALALGFLETPGPVEEKVVSIDIAGYKEPDKAAEEAEALRLSAMDINILPEEYIEVGVVPFGRQRYSSRGVAIREQNAFRRGEDVEAQRIRNERARRGVVAPRYYDRGVLVRERDAYRRGERFKPVWVATGRRGAGWYSPGGYMYYGAQQSAPGTPVEMVETITTTTSMGPGVEIDTMSGGGGGGMPFGDDNGMVPADQQAAAAEQLMETSGEEITVVSDVGDITSRNINAFNRREGILPDRVRNAITARNINNFNRSEGLTQERAPRVVREPVRGERVVREPVRGERVVREPVRSERVVREEPVRGERVVREGVRGPRFERWREGEPPYGRDNRFAPWREGFTVTEEMRSGRHYNPSPVWVENGSEGIGWYSPGRHIFYGSNKSGPVMVKQKHVPVWVERGARGPGWYSPSGFVFYGVDRIAPGAPVEIVELIETVDVVAPVEEVVEVDYTDDGGDMLVDGVKTEVGGQYVLDESNSWVYQETK